MTQGNWGRWGPADELGTLNLVTADVTQIACALVKEGSTYSLGQPLGPDTVVPDHRKRVERFMTRDGGDYAAGARSRGGFKFAEDVVSFATHSGTHIDSLAHAWVDDHLYNGFPAASVRSTTGAQNCGASALRPVVTRGVLLDVAAAFDGEMAAGTQIGADLLASAALRGGVELRQGDAILVRTGWYGSTHGQPDVYLGGEPGINLEGAQWLAATDPCLVGSDNFAIEVMPFADEVWFPVHQLLLRDLGMPLIEGMVLDELADAGSGEFLFIAAPVPLVGSTAAPVNPLAVV